MSKNIDPEKIVREIKRKTRREGISPNLYYNWCKEFLEAGKRRLMGDTKREATTGEVSHLKSENLHLKQLVADLALKNQVLKKT